MYGAVARIHEQAYGCEVYDRQAVHSRYTHEACSTTSQMVDNRVKCCALMKLCTDTAHFYGGSKKRRLLVWGHWSSTEAEAHVGATSKRGKRRWWPRWQG
eukprot:scaffold275500_cov12-Tisochrysis_lutea.AAC.1